VGALAPRRSRKWVFQLPSPHGLVAKFLHVLADVYSESCCGSFWMFSSAFAIFAQIIMVVLICTDLISVSYTIGFIPAYAFLAMQCLPPCVSFDDSDEDCCDKLFDRVGIRVCMAWFVWGQFLCFFALVNAKLEGFNITGLAAFSPFLATALAMFIAVIWFRYKEGMFTAIVISLGFAPFVIWIAMLALYVNRLWNPADPLWAPSLMVANIPLFIYMVPMLIGLVYVFNDTLDDECCCPDEFYGGGHSANSRRHLQVDFESLARRIPE